MVVARRRQGGFLQLPCSLGFRLASSATGGARLRPPAAFEKSGGKPADALFRFSSDHAGALLTGSGALGLFMEDGRVISKGAAGLWSLRRPIPAFVHIGNVPLPCARHGPSGGGAAAGRFAPCAREAGAFSPCLPRAVCGPGGRRPPGPQTPPPPALPPPSAGAAAFRGRGQRPRPRNKPAAGRCPAAGGWAAPTRRRAEP